MNIGRRRGTSPEDWSHLGQGLDRSQFSPAENEAADASPIARRVFDRRKRWPDETGRERRGRRGHRTGRAPAAPRPAHVCTPSRRRFRRPKRTAAMHRPSRNAFSIDENAAAMRPIITTSPRPTTLTEDRARSFLGRESIGRARRPRQQIRNRFRIWSARSGRAGHGAQTSSRRS